MSIKDEIEKRKNILNEHYEKFKKLKDEGDYIAAWEQLIVTLNYANDMIVYSSNIIKNLSISKDLEEIDKVEDEKELKFIIIPKKQTIN